MPKQWAEAWVKKNISPARIEMIPHGCDFPEKAPDYKR